MPLTDAAIRNAKPREKAYKLSDSGGLYLHVSTTGARLWRYSYKLHGKWGLYAIGQYPEISLTEAREAHRRARALVKTGQQPTWVRKQERARTASEAANTFGAIAQEWLERNADRWSPNYRQQVQRMFETAILPALGERPIRLIVAADILVIMRALEHRGPVPARTARLWISKVFQYAAATLRADHDPAGALKSVVAAPVVQHYATLSRGELGDLLRAVDRYPGLRQSIILIRLLALTFVRPSELREATWSEIDWEQRLWRIPAERMKKRAAHVVPLSDQALTLLQELKVLTGTRDHLFPNNSDPRRPMSPSTANFIIRQLGFAGRLSAHGFRGTASTILNELGYRPDVIERQLAHVPLNKVRAAYNHAEYLPERTRMMQEWADLLTALEQRQNVVPIGAARRVAP